MSRMRAGRTNFARGFTLVEVLIVTIIVGVLATAVVQLVATSSEDSRIASARGTVRAIKNVIALQHAKTGQWPAEIDPTWFDGEILPGNAATVSDRALKVKIAQPDRPLKFDPSNIIFDGSENDRTGYWYNPANGAFRARVDERLFDDPVAAYDAINK